MKAAEALAQDGGRGGEEEVNPYFSAPRVIFSESHASSKQTKEQKKARVHKRKALLGTTDFNKNEYHEYHQHKP